MSLEKKLASKKNKISFGFHDAWLALLIAVFLYTLILGGYGLPFEFNNQLNIGLLFLVSLLFRKWFLGEYTTLFTQNLMTRFLTFLIQNESRVFKIGSIFYISQHFIVQKMRHLSFQTNAYDLTYIDQSIFLTWAGKGFLASELSKGGTYLGEHFSPILAILSPFYLFFNDSTWMFLLQPSMIVIGLWIFNQILKHIKMNREVRVPLVLIAALFGPIVQANLFDFREDYFFVPLFFLLSLGVLKKNYRIVWIAALLSALTKENAQIALFGFSVWIWFEGNKKHAISLALFSIVSFLIINLLVSPYFSGGIQNTIFGYRVASMSPEETQLSGLFSKIFPILNRMFGSNTLKYLFNTFLFLLPLMTFKNKRSILAIGISFLLFFMNRGIGIVSPHFHYELIFYPVILLAIAFSVKVRVNQLGKENFVLILFALMLMTNKQSAAFRMVHHFQPTEGLKCMKELTDSIPKSIGIATQSGILPHLHHRKFATWEMGNQNVDWIILSKEIQYSGIHIDKLTQQFNRSKDYRTLISEDWGNVWCKRKCDNNLKKKLPTVCLSN